MLSQKAKRYCGTQKELTRDIIKWVVQVDETHFLNTEGLASRVPATRAGLKRLYQFVRAKVQYLADPRGSQFVKSPAQTFQDGYGDCKSMSVMVGTTLKNMGLPYKYRFTGYDGDDYTHVYVLAKIGKRWITIDATMDLFDYEVPYSKKKDVVPRGSAISGPKIPEGWGFLIGLSVASLAGYFIYKRVNVNKDLYHIEQ